MRYFKPLAFLALVLTLCMLPKLTAEEKLDLPGAKPPPVAVAPVAVVSLNIQHLNVYPWDTPLEAQLREELERIVQSVMWDGESFERCIEDFGNLVHFNVVVNWSALETAAIERDREVSIRLRSVSARTLIRLLLEEVGGGEVDLEYSIRGGVLSISTKEDLCRTTQVVFYNVGDILRAAEIKQFFRDDSMCRLVSMLQCVVEPDSWREAGGNTGAISDFSDILVITQTPQAHEWIWDTLQALRSQLGLPIDGAITPTVVK